MNILKGILVDNAKSGNHKNLWKGNTLTSLEERKMLSFDARTDGSILT
jgi:hypothetical protein